MTATLRRTSAAGILDHWQQAAELRGEWLDVGVATAPADRDAAEHILTRLYTRHRRARPRFAWVESPRQGAGPAAGIPGHDQLQHWLRPRPPAGRPPLAADIAATWSAMMTGLDEGAAQFPPAAARSCPATARKGDKPWPVLPPVRALEAGVPLRLVLRQHIREALRTVLMDSIALPVRTALGPPGQTPICWYGQQDAYWIAHYDILRRLGLAHYPPPLSSTLDDWIALARATGWWWPGEKVCVLVERPAGIGPVHLAADTIWTRTRPAVTYRDGWRPH